MNKKPRFCRGFFVCGELVVNLPECREALRERVEKLQHRPVECLWLINGCCVAGVWDNHQPAVWNALRQDLFGGQRHCGILLTSNNQRRAGDQL